MNTQSANLSGGNKRKLCVANALIGSPQLLFLDEPSTGLDPLAKKYLWNLLYSTVRNRNASMLLTTHTLTEAEYLSDKIGIMVTTPPPLTHTHLSPLSARAFPLPYARRRTSSRVCI